MQYGVVHAFEANTPSEKLPGTQINVPRLNLHKRPLAPPVPHFPRFRALALFGRRPQERVDSIVMPASENLHMKRLMHRSKQHRYSITSSARSSNVDGISSPSAFAVFTLTTSWNLVA